MGLTATNFHTSLAILATFLLLSAAAAGRPKPPVSPFCKSSTDKALCTAMLKGAQTWPEAMSNVLAATIQKAKAGKPIAYGVAARLPGNLKPQTKKSIESTCKEAYDSLLKNLQSCMGLVKSDPSSLKYRLPSLNLFDCTDAMEEFEISVPAVSRFDAELQRMGNTVVAVLEKKKSKKSD